MAESISRSSGLELVNSTLPDPPYPPETRAAGWGLMLDTTRIRQSDTWTLARPEIRPWLLLLWMIAWEQSPAGTLPSDDALVAALLGIDASLFAAHRNIIMRGWTRCSDGRLYHPVMTEHVIKMIESRKSDRERHARWRERHVSPKATRLPPDWKIPEDWLAWAEEVHGIDRQRGVRISLAFRDYWVSTPGVKGCKLDWAATWRNWIRKETGDA